MTDGEALALITSSQPFKNARGNYQKAWKNFADLNPQAAKWLFVASSGEIKGPIPPGVTQTLYGRGICHFVTTKKVVLVPTFEIARAPAPDVEPDPVVIKPPTSGRSAVTGAIVISGSAMMDCENSNHGLHTAGVKHLAIQIGPEDDDVLANYEGFDRGMANWFESRGFLIGGFIVNYFDPIYEANQAFNMINKYGLDFLVCDIERHKADQASGDMLLTSTLMEQLRNILGPDFPIWAIGFGQHSSPQVVNHLTLFRHNVDYIDECYDEKGYSDSVIDGVDKVAREGRAPADICLGNKSLINDAGWIRQLRVIGGNRLRDVWVWRPESGEAQEALTLGFSLKQ